MIGNDVIPAAKRRGSHEITVQVINESGNTIGDFPFEYKDTIANKLVDGLLKEKKNDSNWRKGNGKGKGKGKGKGENKGSDFLHSASNSNYPVDTPLLAYLCDVAAKKGAEHFFNALLKLGISITALQHSDDCYKDFALTAMEHGHEGLAEKIVQYRVENLKFDVSGTTLKKLIAAVDDVVSRAENESDTDSVSEYNDDSCGSGYGGDLESEEISTEENSEEEKELLLLDNEKSEDKSQYWWKILLGRCEVILFVLITIFVLILFVLCSHYIYRNDGSPTMPVNSSEMFIHRSRSFWWGCQQRVTAMKNQTSMNYISSTSNMTSIGYLEIFPRQPAVYGKKRVPYVQRNCCASCTCPKRHTAMKDEKSMKYVLSTSIVLVGKPGLWKSKLSLLIGRKNLEQYSYIFIDEAHDRSIETDLLLAMIKQNLPQHPDLILIVTLATLNTEIFRKYFRKNNVDCPFIKVQGRTFPVERVYAKVHQGDYVEQTFEKVVEVCESGEEGDILTFLTQQNDIEKTCEKSQKKLGSANNIILPRHGKLQPEEQEKVFKETSKGKRKIVVATNSAETLITINGIRIMIDSGMVKEPSFDPACNMTTWDIKMVSRSSALQMFCRARRTSARKCYRSRSFCWGFQQRVTAMKNQRSMKYVSSTSNMTSIGYIEIFTSQPAVNERKRVPYVQRNCCAICTFLKRDTAMKNERSMKYVLNTQIVLVGMPGLGKSRLSLLIERENFQWYSCTLIDRAEAMVIKMSIIAYGLIIIWLVSVWFYYNYSVSEGDHEVCRRPNFLCVVGKGHKNDTSYQGKTVARSCMSGVCLISTLTIVLPIIDIIVHTLILPELDVKLSYSSTGESYSLDVEYPSSDQIKWYFGAEVTLFSCDAALGTLMLSIFLVGVFCLFRKCRRKCCSISSVRPLRCLVLSSSFHNSRKRMGAVGYHDVKDINDVGKGHKNDTSYQVATSGMFRQASNRLLFPRVLVLVFIVIVSTMALSGHRNIPSSTYD